jgi:hypothetical protein
MNYNLRLLDKKYYKFLLIIFFLSYLASLPFYIKKNILFKAIAQDLFLIIILLYERNIKLIVFLIFLILDIITTNFIGLSLINFIFLKKFYFYAEKRNWPKSFILIIAIILLEIFNNAIRFIYNYPLDFSWEQNLISILLLPFLLKLSK